MHARGSATRGTKSEVATSPLPSRGPKKGAELLCNPCILGRPQQGHKIRSGYLTRVFSGAQKTAELLCNPCILGGRQLGGKNQKWLPHPCLLGGPQEGGSATKRNKIRSRYLTPPFSGARRGEICYATRAFSGVPNKGGKIGSGYFNPPFSGAQGGPNCYVPHALSGSQTRGQNQKWPPHACLLGGPSEDGAAT